MCKNDEYLSTNIKQKFRGLLSVKYTLQNQAIRLTNIPLGPALLASVPGPRPARSAHCSHPSKERSALST